MNVYVFALIAAAVVIAITVAAYFMFFRVGKSEGSATAQLGTAQADLSALKKADTIAATEVTHAELDKNLRDGSF